MIKPARVGQSAINPDYYDVFVCGLALRMIFDDKDIALQVADSINGEIDRRRNKMRLTIAFWCLMIVSISPWIVAWIFWRFGK
jgi:hypothetical protein